jgi:hypothetical protein
MGSRIYNISYKEKFEKITVIKLIDLRLSGSRLLSKLV